ncbi:alpha/beta hydrolase [Actinophytocola sp.]|uniref:alpha/beta fold hydrolase n=1 Tax=Actinophytocola sp. TaxID=1872138 RepID=UPI002ED16177
MRLDRRGLLGLGVSTAALAATGGVTEAAAATPRAVLPGFREGHAAGLHYVTGGTGAPLVLIPGWPQTWWEFHKIMPALARRYRVIAVDLPGIGGSRPAAGDKKSIARAVHGLVQALGLGPVHVAGHDIGAMVAFSFAANHPAATRTVTIMDVAHPDEHLYEVPLLAPPGQPHPWWFAFNQLRGLPEQLLAGRSRYLVDHLCELLLVDQSAIGNRDRALYAAAYATLDTIRVGNSWYQSLHQDIEDQKAYGTITVPMLGIASLASPYLEYQLKGRGTDVRIVDVPTSGHFLPEEQPDVVVEAITALIG